MAQRDPETTGFTRALRRRSCTAERTLWQIVRNRQRAGAKFRRQFAIGPYVADFACVEALLIVEVDGPSHGTPEAQAKDVARTAFLESLGWRVLRLSNRLVLDQSATAIARIECALAIPSPLPLSPRGERG